MVSANLHIYFNPRCLKDGATPIDIKDHTFTEVGKASGNGIIDGRYVVSGGNYIEFDATAITGRDFTLEAVFKNTPALTNKSIVGFGNNSSTKSRTLFVNNAGKIILYFGSDSLTISNANIEDGEYHHVVITGKNAEPFKGYLDGVLVHTSSNPWSYYCTDIDTATAIGTIGTGLSKLDLSTYKDLKLVRVYNAALTHGQVLENLSEMIPLNPSSFYTKDGNGDWSKCRF